MAIVLLGPPGSGKTTLAGQLEDRLGTRSIAIGARLRELASRDAAVAGIVDSGGFVPDDVAWGLVAPDIEKVCKDGTNIVLDGFPRTRRQVELLDSALRACGAHVAVFWLQVDEATVINRIEKRVAGTAQHRRDDRSASAVTRRLDLHRDLSCEVRQEYSRLSVLRDIDAGASQDEVYATVARWLSPLLSERT